jgi:hypothetical protein
MRFSRITSAEGEFPASKAIDSLQAAQKRALPIDLGSAVIVCALRPSSGERAASKRFDSNATSVRGSWRDIM